MSSQIHNPILPGFNPDPSICRAGDDYYIATSTFEWWPGVQLHHSRDLAHWQLIGHALTEPYHIDLIGSPNSGGVWAPCLTYAQGLFWLIYSNVRSWHGPYKDVHNYLVTAQSINGPWSEPVYLNSSGFDPSLFHDDDGRQWICNQRWHHRRGSTPFAGIVLQEYDHNHQQLVGPVYDIFDGVIGAVEGPHIYRRNGWYYLMTAEGGTSYDHAVTLARSRKLTGPYEVHPNNPLLTAKDTGAKLQKSGHGSWVSTPDDEWYLVHLCARPLADRPNQTEPLQRCMLGRETAIQRLTWHNDGWPRLSDGGNTPYDVVSRPNLPDAPLPPPPEHDDFDDHTLSPHYASLRDRIDASWCNLEIRPGFIRLVGRESLTSHHHQSLIARRIQSFNITAITCLEFAPQNIQQMAGLIFFYDTENYYFCYLSAVKNQYVINIKVMDNGSEYDVLLPTEAKSSAQTSTTQGIPEIIVPPEAQTSEGSIRLWLRGDLFEADLNFAWSLDGKTWQAIDYQCDASTLSDEYRTPLSGGNFTGAFTGMACQDFTGNAIAADFDCFHLIKK